MWLCRVKAANDTSVVANVMMNEDSLLTGLSVSRKQS